LSKFFADEKDDNVKNKQINSKTQFWIQFNIRLLRGAGIKLQIQKTNKKLALDEKEIK